tara:strand:+ start:1504 stop:1698 length:195 start_codon:yes stop_codon:yes gene_type:complete
LQTLEKEKRGRAIVSSSPPPVTYTRYNKIETQSLLDADELQSSTSFYNDNVETELDEDFDLQLT